MNPQNMNPQNTNPRPTINPAAQARAMQAANRGMMPMNVPNTPSNYQQPVQPGQAYPQYPQAPQPQPQAYTQQPTYQQPPTPTIPEITKAAENPLSTQATLLFSEIRDGIIIMKDGSFRAVVACQSINFDLMSDIEREGVEYSYQNFLNSLNFTIQILVRSQRVDLGPYIEHLVSLRRNNDNMLLGVLMDDYIDFIDALSREANIMDKSFFIVIPYYSSLDMEKAVEQTKNLFRTFGGKTQNVTRINRDVYNKAIDELNNRVESVVSGLYHIGIHSVRLGTRELSELFYNFNNPDTAVREPLVDFSQLGTTFITKGERKNG